MLKKVLILGVTGTLGHKIARISKRQRLLVYGTFNQIEKYKRLKPFLTLKKFYKANNIKSIILLAKKFDYIINCIGQIKQKKTQKKSILI